MSTTPTGEPGTAAGSPTTLDIRAALEALVEATGGLLSASETPMHDGWQMAPVWTDALLTLDKARAALAAAPPECGWCGRRADHDPVPGICEGPDSPAPAASPEPVAPAPNSPQTPASPESERCAFVYPDGGRCHGDLNQHGTRRHSFQPAPTPEALREHTHTAAIRYDGRWHTVAVTDHDVWYVDGKPIEAMASIATFDRALTADEVAGIARAVFAADALGDDRR